MNIGHFILRSLSRALNLNNANSCDDIPRAERTASPPYRICRTLRTVRQIVGRRGDQSSALRLLDAWMNRRSASRCQFADVQAGCRACTHARALFRPLLHCRDKPQKRAWLAETYFRPVCRPAASEEQDTAPSRHCYNRLNYKGRAILPDYQDDDAVGSRLCTR